jgi:thymidylate synthase (FAD)
MSAPVPIRTQCFKHKQGFVENEESRRYISSEPELFVPEYFRTKPEGSIKQGSGEKHYDSAYWLFEYEEHCKEGLDIYLSMIQDGVCPEQARFVLPQGCIVNWIWTGSLYAYANFYNKRTDSHAQKEIQDLAKQVDKIIRPFFPVSWAALVGDEK